MPKFFRWTGVRALDHCLTCAVLASGLVLMMPATLAADVSSGALIGSSQVTIGGEIVAGACSFDATELQLHLGDYSDRYFDQNTASPEVSLDLPLTCTSQALYPFLRLRFSSDSHDGELPNDALSTGNDGLMIRVTFNDEPVDFTGETLAVMSEASPAKLSARFERVEEGNVFWGKVERTFTITIEYP